MKKKVLFMIINMNVGGTEKALLNMIEALPKNKYDITILMLEKYGGLLNSIPDWVNIEYLDGYNQIKEVLNKPPRKIIMNYLKKLNILSALIFFFLFFLSKITKDKSTLFKYILNNYKLKDIKYDIAVAYAGPMDFISYFVIHKIKAKKKIQWIHFDITKIGFNQKFASKLYDKFDKIFIVSQEAKTKLLKIIPALEMKVEIFYNLISSKTIETESKNGLGFNDGFTGLRILTVGRLSLEKGQDMAIHVLTNLINDGYQVKWYCVGDGSERKQYEELIEKYKVKDHFILLGSTPNPYPFIDQCDIYVQPSRYEGYCLTILEAACLKKPIITTDVNGVREQINNGVSGIIVGINESEIYEAVKQVIDKEEMRHQFSLNLSRDKKDYDISLGSFLKIG